MLKKLILLAVVTLFCVFQVNLGHAAAVELDKESRTVVLNPEGESVVFSLEQIEKGERLFNGTCSECHNSGRTKTNPNVELGFEDLNGAEPSRANVLAMVDYLKNPTTYDGERDLSELHPNTNRVDLYPEMRNFDDEDLKNVSGYILIQPKIRGILWGGGKVYN
jgi:photosystem II cytochrome c550